MEGSSDAALLIAVSHQARTRITKDLITTAPPCDCLVMIVFAAFFIEASLNYIIFDNIKPKGVGLNIDDGMTRKMSWIYTKYIMDKETGITSDKKAYLSDENIIKMKLEFEGFEEIRKFRNDVSHGKVKKSELNLENARSKRDDAKRIVEKLYAVVNENNGNIEKLIDYEKALEPELLNDENRVYLYIRPMDDFPTHLEFTGPST